MSYRNYILVFGAIPGVAIISLILLSFAGVFGDPQEFIASSLGEVFGYATMVLFLGVFLFVGVKRYRDREADGELPFKRAFLTGLYMVLIASAVYVVGWMVFGPADFMDTYAAQQIAAIEADTSLSVADRGKQIAYVEQSVEMMQNPAIKAFVTFTEIFPVGLILALIAGLVLRTKPQPTE